MTDFLDITFWDNTIADWAIAFIFIFGSYTIAKSLYFISSRVVKKITAKTDTKFDDLIIDMVEEPLTFGLIIAGFWFAFEHLVLPEKFYLYAHKVLYVVITFNVSWLIVRLVDAILIEYLHPLVSKTESTLDDQLFPILRKTVKFALWTIAIIVGLNNAGYDVGALIAGLGLGGLAFAMAAKDTVANLFGGMTVFVDKPFKIKDRIQIDKYDGFVSEIGIRSTRLRTLENRIVTIPNARFASDIIINVSLEPTRKVEINLSLTYDTGVEKMKAAQEILRNICKENSGVEDETHVTFNRFDASALNLQLIYYIKKESDIFEVQNTINLEILRRFEDNQISFAYPTYTVLSKAVE